MIWIRKTIHDDKNTDVLIYWKLKGTHFHQHIKFNFNCIFHKNYVPVSILCMGIFISLVITDSHVESIGANIYTMLPHFVQLSLMFSTKITHQLNITMGNSHLNLPSSNHMMEYEGMNINTMLPHHIQHQSHFPQKICISCYFIKDNFHWMFTKELHGEVHGHKYLYCDTTPHLNCNCLNLVCEAIFWKVIFTYFMQYNFQAHFWECALYS